MKKAKIAQGANASPATLSGKGPFLAKRGPSREEIFRSDPWPRGGGGGDGSGCQGGAKQGQAWAHAGTDSSSGRGHGAYRDMAGTHCLPGRDGARLSRNGYSNSQSALSLVGPDLRAGRGVGWLVAGRPEEPPTTPAHGKTKGRQMNFSNDWKKSSNHWKICAAPRSERIVSPPSPNHQTIKLSNRRTIKPSNRTVRCC